MSNVKLESNTMNLICRTCLNMNKNQHNIFKHLQHNRIVSDLIMECIPIKLEDSDQFPLNICDNCLQKLSAMWEFRALVIQSDIKLQHFYQIERSKSRIRDKNMLGNEVTSSQDIHEIKYKVSINDEENSINLHNRENICEESVNILNGSSDNDTDNINHNGNESNETFKSGNIKERDKIIEAPIKDATAIRHKKRNYKRLDTSRNVNEKQAELLDNADYKRIVKLPISRREKTLLPVYCPDCNKSFSFQYFVTVHAHLHTGNLPFKCEKCDMRFPKRTILKQHMHKHVKTKNNPCDLCDKSFFRPSALKLHKLQVHSTERPHKCEICGKTFKIVFSLQKHIRMHNNEKSHVCEICGKAFIDLGALTNHKRVHCSEKSFSCTVCGKKFTYQRSLKAHNQVHTNERPYTCDQCGRSFRLSMLLKQHMLIHTGEKPFSCEICSKKFRTRSVLILHRRTHTGETPYPCNLCSSAFKYRHHLANHKKVHHKDEFTPKLKENTQT